jgi:hypothetical protein
MLNKIDLNYFYFYFYIYIMDTSSNINSNQSQKHGFLWENSVRTNVFKLSQHNNDTNIHDIPHYKNTLNPNENISIKTTNSNTICCADILRFYNYDFNKINTIIVIKYKQSNDYKNIQIIYQINYNKECHEYLFGNLPEHIIRQYVENIKSIPKSIKGNEAKKIFNYLEEKKKIKQNYNYNIQINPKVDSKQSRVQCSITNFEEKLKKFIISESTTDKPNLLRNNLIISSIKSSKRIRQKNII